MIHRATTRPTLSSPRSAGQVVVAKGDTLSAIAKRMLGSANRWREIYEANRQVIGDDPGAIRPGMALRMPGDAKAPAAEPASLAKPAAKSTRSGSLWDLARQAGRKHGVDPALVMAVIKKESHGDPRAKSGAGARGLMQLMPLTARSLGVRNAYDPEQNVDAGTRYLKDLIDQFGDVKLALMAYNWGPGNVRSHQRGRKHPPRETRQYVPTVLAYYRQFGGTVAA